jgi:hypothetical protein
LESFGAGHSTADLLQLSGDAENFSFTSWSPLKHALKLKDVRLISIVVLKNDWYVCIG